MKYTTLLLFSLFSLSIVAQTNTGDTKIFSLYQDSLKTICSKLFKPDNKDAVNEKLNQQLLATFETALNMPNSINFPFDSLSILKYISILVSSDNKFRIINWNVPKNDGTQIYYGFIQEKYEQVIKHGIFKKQRIESVQLYPLIDKSAEIKNPDNYISDNKKWFGMLYYKIILKKTKAKKYYTLLGWDGNDKITRKKIIDVLTFDNNGTPRFGADIFNMQKKYPKRIIFEYSANCNMSLRFSTKKDSIVFDHLAPNSPQLEGQYQYYCNDGSYDGFGFKGGKWNYGMDLNAINEKDEKDKIYIDPRTDTSNKKESRTLKQDRKKKKQK